jgi:chemotaxis protein histidine kinase CheA
MASTKAIEFIGSSEYFEIIKKIGDLFNIIWGDKRMPKIIALINDILRHNQTSETPVKELIKKWLDFLNEDEVNKLYNFLEENFLPKVRELWQEEETQESVEEEAQEESFEKTEEESFEERAKRYIELMQTIIKYPQRPKQEKVEEKPKKKEETKKEAEEYKTITFQPQQEHKKEAEEESLPEDVIVITKKKEEKPPQGEEFLDLSRL